MPKSKKKIQTKKISAKAQFNEAISYVKESKNYIFSSIYIFIFAAIMGFIFKDNLNFIEDLIRQIVLKTKSMDTFEITFFIMQNNMQSSFMSIFTGIAFGLFPIIYSLLNGLVLGYVLALSMEVAGILSFWRLLPHGVFELPAIFISFGLGIKLGFSLFVEKKHRIQEFKRRFYNSMNTLLMIVIPLLIIAGIIEGLLIGFLS